MPQEYRYLMYLLRGYTYRQLCYDSSLISVLEGSVVHMSFFSSYFSFQPLPQSFSGAVEGREVYVF